MAFKYHISFVTNLAANLNCNWFRIVPLFPSFAHSHLKSLCCLIRIWADSFFLDRLSSSISLLLAQDSISNMWICSYTLFLLRNQWMIKIIEGSNERCFGWQHDLAKLLWKFQFTWKMFLLSVTCHCSKITNHYNILTVKPSQCSKSGSNFFVKRGSRGQQRLQQTQKQSVFVLARLTSPSCAGALPQELCHWFCSQSLLLSSGISFGIDCQMICRGSNLESNLNSAAWPTSCNGFICSKKPEQTVWNSKSFKVCWKRRNEVQQWVDFNPLPPS